MMSSAFVVAGWVIFGIWLLAAVPSFLWLLRSSLPSRGSGGEAATSNDRWPSVSVIVAARDEGPNIEATLLSLLASDYPGLQLLAVNDRSDDDTGCVMDRLASTDSRLTVVHVECLPPGWLGKNHAMHVASQAAHGEYLLFTDGDVLFSPEAIRLAVEYTLANGVDHLCLLPRMHEGGYWENALVTFFGLIFVLGTQAWLVRTRLKRAYAGIGAFNLVRARAYRDAGGHVPIRMDVLDDVKLGKLMKQSGFRQNCLTAGEHVRVRWQASAWQIVRGLEKNGFAALEYSLLKVAVATVLFSAFLIWPYAAVAIRPDAHSTGYCAALLLAHGLFAGLGRLWGGGWRVMPALPIAAMAMAFAFWRSTWITLRWGGVRWRGTFYPLKQLRQNVYR